jgi:hypothetical protein
VTFFGIVESDGTVPQDPPRDTFDRAIYVRPQGRNFVIVVEARRGPNNVPPGTVLLNSNEFDPSARPDLQIQADQDLGLNPTSAVCDKSAPDLGGVPKIVPPNNYDPSSQAVANSLNDFACRFGTHTTGTEACTNNALGSPAFKEGPTQIQYCTEPPISGEMEFPVGDTILTVQVRDEGGGIGDPVQIIVSVLPP